MPPSLSPVLVDTSRSPRARLRPVPLGAVRLSDRLWEPRRERNRKVTLPGQYRLCEETGRIDNFRRAAGKVVKPFQGRYYNDSDVYKWVEAVSWSLAEHADPELQGLLEWVIAEIAAAQEPDGYLNTHFTFEKAALRWTNLRDWHELYCAGHLIQAAVAHYRVTGEESLLVVALRLAECILREFGPDGRNGTCGHQEIEMALVELSRLTGDARFLRQAVLFLDRRGQDPPVIGGSPYHQDHLPFRRLSEVTGHAVRMAYYCAGAADVVLEMDEPEFEAALDRLWTNMTSRRMYVTGGIGSRYEGEAFGEDWELPNDRAYAESCAAIGSVLWNWRMLQLRAHPRYADLIETALYNAILPGLSLDGERYFYQNPLADGGSHRRQPWFECACCPPNLARLLASLPSYFYSTSEAGIWVHLYGASTARLSIAGGVAVLEQSTEYPWSGEVRFRWGSVPEGFALPLFLRIPAWAEGALVTAGEGPGRPAAPGSYHRVEPPSGSWREGDAVGLRLPESVRVVRSHPMVACNAGRVALFRGPILYCAEAVDVGGDPRLLVVEDPSVLRPEGRPELLGGVVALTGVGRFVEPGPGWDGVLYRGDGGGATTSEARAVTLVPYYAWANREPGPMAVWLQEGGV